MIGKIYHTNINQKKAREATLISDKVDVSRRNSRRDKDSHSYK